MQYGLQVEEGELAAPELAREAAALQQATAAAVQGFRALLAEPEEGAADPASQAASPLLPALRRLRRLLQGQQAQGQPDLVDAAGRRAALSEARAMDDLLRACFEPLDPAGPAAAPTPADDAASSNGETTVEARLRSAFSSVLARHLRQAALTALSQHLQAVGPKPAVNAAAAGPVASSRAALGGQDRAPGSSEALEQAVGPAAWQGGDLEVDAALEAADEGLNQAHGLESIQDEEEGGAGLDWLDEEALHQNREAGMLRMEDDVPGWGAPGEPHLAGQDAHLQPFFDFDEAASSAGDALEASALEPTAAGAAGSFSPAGDSSNTLSSSTSSTQGPAPHSTAPGSPSGKAVPNVAANGGSSSSAALDIALPADLLGTDGTEGEAAGLPLPSLAALAQSGSAEGASQQALGTQAGPLQQPAGMAAEEGLSEGAHQCLAAMEAAAQACGRHRVAEAVQAAAEAASEGTPQAAADARAALVRYEWVHEPVLAAAVALGPPLEAPSPVRTAVSAAL